MNVGKTLFAQVMEFVPWKTFGRIIERHKGDAGVRTLGCADLVRLLSWPAQTITAQQGRLQRRSLFLDLGRIQQRHQENGLEPPLWPP